MPLFRRPDGVLITGLSPERAIMPYLMPGRNESAVYHEAVYDISKTRHCLRAYNRAEPAGAATLFHLFLWACGKALNEFPDLNRFVSGGRLYQRNRTEISFAAKRTFSPGAPLVAVKVPFPPEQAFERAVQRVTLAIDEARSSAKRSIDRELKLALLLPGPLLRVAMGCLRSLDRVNLLPKQMLANDPMYASMFVANLGSIGLDNTFHHLYEYGSVSIFAVMGRPRKTTFVGRDGRPEVRDGLQVCWTFDERITDGYYVTAALKLVQNVIETPERFSSSLQAVATITHTVSPRETA
jgi:2-oxoacid dehydrogenases acyltransferase (catalytic domain)